MANQRSTYANATTQQKLLGRLTLDGGSVSDDIHAWSDRPMTRAVPAQLWVASCGRSAGDSAWAGLELLRRDTAGVLRRAGGDLPVGGASCGGAQPGRR